MANVVTLADCRLWQFSEFHAVERALIPWQVFFVEATSECAVKKNDQANKALIALPLALVEVPQNARAIGQLIDLFDCPRRKIPHRLQLRFDYWQDDGGKFLDYYGDPFPIDDDFMDLLFPEPSCRWLSAFPKRCMGGPLLQAPNVTVQKRLQAIELGIRTPPVGYAL